MNRADRRRMMKTIPGYKETVNNAAKKAVNDLGKMFQKQWREHDETLNDGDRDYYDDWDDEIYND